MLATAAVIVFALIAIKLAHPSPPIAMLAMTGAAVAPAIPIPIATLADLPDEMLLPLDSTISGKPTARLYSDLSPEAILTWYEQYTVQLAERRRMISVGNLKLIVSGRAEKRDPALVAEERAERAVRRAERAKASAYNDPDADAVATLAPE
jgi:hypothetical protein